MSFLISLEPEMRIPVNEREYFYNPETGVYIPPQKKPKCLGHTYTSSYWEPCLECEMPCNCDHKLIYPDIIVRTFDNENIRVSSSVIAMSATLQDRMNLVFHKAQKRWHSTLLESNTCVRVPRPEDIWRHEEQHMKESKIKKDVCTENFEDDNCSYTSDIEVITIESSDDEGIGTGVEIVELRSNKQKHQNSHQFDSIEPTVELRELFEFRQAPVIDLREGNEPTYGITTAQWRLFEKFAGHHFDQVVEDVDAEKRARDYFSMSIYTRPKKAPLNIWRYYEWEEQMFGNISPKDLMELSQALHELEMLDVFRVVWKWFGIFQGIPMVKDFGSGRYTTELTPEMCDSGIEDFCEGGSRWGKELKKYGYKIEVHNDIPHQQSTRSALRWRKRIWKRYPTITSRWNH